SGDWSSDVCSSDLAHSRGDLVLERLDLWSQDELLARHDARDRCHHLVPDSIKLSLKIEKGEKSFHGLARLGAALRVRAHRVSQRLRGQYTLSFLIAERRASLLRRAWRRGRTGSGAIRSVANRLGMTPPEKVV